MKAILFALPLLILVSCDHRAKLEAPMQMAALAEANEVSMKMPEVSTISEAYPATLSTRMLIKDGALRFKTTDLSKTKAAIAEICKTTGAYISNETMSNESYNTSYHQVIRVPAAQFEALVQKVEQLSDTLDEKNIESRDVTEEFIDVEARLKTKKEVEQRYRELLHQAKTVNNMLDIEREIGNVRTEIESMEGRLKYLKSQVAFSTLTVDYYQVTETSFGFASRFASSFVTGWENLLSFLIGLSAAWPFLILLGGAIWWVKRVISKRLAPAT